MAALTSTISALAHAIPGTRTNRLLILIYHRVRAEPSSISKAALYRAVFDWQMQLVAQHCKPFSLLDGLRLMHAGSLPARSIAVTFDDGYADNADVALPVLLHHGVPATFFVATGFLDGGRMWNDTIVESIRQASAGRVDLGVVGLGVVSLGPVHTRGPLVRQVVSAVKHLPSGERSARAQAVCELVGADLTGDLMMTSNQVRGLADAGMEIGAHTVNHPILKSLSGDEARREIEDSRRTLERITGRPVRSFAYPNGRPGDDYTARDRDLVAALGFDCAVATTSGVATRHSDSFQLPRFTPWDPTRARWLSRLLLAYGRPA